MDAGEIVYKFKKKNKEGFTKYEIEDLLKLFPDIDMKKFNNNMMGHTCPMIDGELVIYTHDVACAIERSLPNGDESEDFD